MAAIHFYVADCEAANQNAEHPAAEAWDFTDNQTFRALARGAGRSPARHE